MKPLTLNKLNIFLLCVCALMVMACGGSGSSLLGLDKQITIQYTNNSSSAVTFVGPNGSTSSLAPGAGTQTTAELQLANPTATTSWAFSAQNSSGTTVSQNSYSWNFVTADSSSSLTVTYDATNGITFNATPKAR